MPRPPYIVNVSALPTAKLRRLNSPSGSIGCSVRDSHHKNVASSAMPDQRRADDARRAPAQRRLADQREDRPGEPQRAERGAEHVDRRARARPRGRWGTAITTNISVKSTNGTLMAKIQRQDVASIS